MGLVMMKSQFLSNNTATLGTKHVLHYYHNNGDNGKQDWKLCATPLKAGAASPDTGPNLDTFGSR